MKALIKDPRKCLTSELLLHELYDINTIYSNEFERRMNLLGLNEDAIKEFRRKEKEIIEYGIENGRRNIALRDYWRDQSLISSDKLILDLKLLTSSEIIGMIEEAVYYYSGLFRLPKLIKNVVEYLAKDQNESLYQIELIERLRSYGFNNKQIKAFIYNEYLLLQKDYYTPLEMKTKFGCSEPWSKESVDISMNGKVILNRYFKDLE